MINIKSNFSKIAVDIDKKCNKIKNTKPVLFKIAQDMVKEAQMNFRNTQDPDGNEWQALSKATIAQRRKGSSKPLIDTGTLRRSIQGTATNTLAMVGTNLKYAAIHQFGGKIDRKEGSKDMYWKHNSSTNTMRLSKKSKSNFVTSHRTKAHSISIPARPYLGINAKMNERYKKWIIEFIKN